MKINIVNDERIFTAFCLLNSVNYNQENRKMGMHKIRDVIRIRLSKCYVSGFLSQICEEKHPYWVAYYTNMLSNPPNFKLKRDTDPRINREFLKLFSSEMRKFYKSNNIGTLYKRYNKTIQQMNNSYKNKINDAIEMVHKFVHIPNNTKSITFYLCPLLSYDCGFNITQHNDRSNIYILQGPKYKVSVHTIVHEYLHNFLSPIVKNRKEYLDSKFKGMKINKNLISSYPNPTSIIDESLVRAVEGNIMNPENVRNKINSLHKDGFVFIKQFYNQVKGKDFIDSNTINHLLDIL